MRRKLASYHYDRPGIAMLTLKARPGVFLCRITPETFTLSSVGTIAEQDLRNISSFYPQLGIDDHQIMPDHLKQGFVFVSPFISPCEKRAFDLVLENGGSCIHLITAEIGPRYKPAGRYFDLCAEGRLLELRAGTQCQHAGEHRHLRLAPKWPDGRASFLYLNTLCAQIAPVCPQRGHTQVQASPASSH